MPKEGKRNERNAEEEEIERRQSTNQQAHTE
jgi:hypothetical protein